MNSWEKINEMSARRRRKLQAQDSSIDGVVDYVKTNITGTQQK